MTSPSRMYVTSDIGPLKRVLVHMPGPEIYKVLVVAPSDHAALPSGLMGDRAIEQHKAFVEILRDQDVEILCLEQLLDEAMANAKADGSFRSWLHTTFPSLSERREITAATLIGAQDDVFYQTDMEGNLQPLVDPMKWMFFTRDFSVMTPRGIVICNFVNYDRCPEASLARFAFEWSDATQEYPIVFDAIQEQVYIQGGDVVVADANTLFIGVGNLTQELAARKLAQKLEMDVVAVQLPGGSSFERENAYAHWTSLHSQFLHLDTAFSFVDAGKALTLPYFFEKKYASCDPLTRILNGLSRSPGVNEQDLKRVADLLKEVGWVTLYRAGSGESDNSVRGMKLVDYLLERNYKIIHVGGESGGIPEFKWVQLLLSTAARPAPPMCQESASFEGNLQLPSDGTGLESARFSRSTGAGDRSNCTQFKYVIERVLRDLRFQAANILAIEPGKLIAYEGNEHTLAALRATGIEVLTFPAYELVRWNGGPHCLTMPLERA